LSRISLAFKTFFAILFGDGLPLDVAKAYGFVKESATRPVPKPAAAVEVRSVDGALQILGILQRDARVVDFLMEDVSPYSDEQVGAAFRQVNEQGRASLQRYATVKPVIDGVTNTRVNVPKANGSSIKLIGNVPPDGKAAAGLLRHNGWRVERIDLPKPAGDLKVLAPAEIEIE
jgi:hypothetical protein